MQLAFIAINAIGQGNWATIVTLGNKEVLQLVFGGRRAS